MNDSKSKEQAHTRFFNAGGICIDHHTMPQRGLTFNPNIRLRRNLGQK
jgi:hypothetical protein